MKNHSKILNFAHYLNRLIGRMVSDPDHAVEGVLVRSPQDKAFM